MANGNGSIIIKDGSKRDFQLKTSLSGNAVLPHNIIEEISGANITKIVDKLTDISSSLANQNLNFTSNTNTLSSLIKKYPTDITKKKYVNENSSNSSVSPLVNIEWDSSSSGSFRIAEYDQDRKYLTVYNDSNTNLYISLDNDTNSKIIVDFDNLIDAKKISIKYDIYSGSNSDKKELFNFDWDLTTNIYTHFTQSHINSSDNKKYGYNINFLTIQYASDQSGKLIINLTPDYTCEVLNKYNVESSGVLTLSMSNGPIANYLVSTVAQNNKKYFNIQANFLNGDFERPLKNVDYYSNDSLTNGFYIFNTGSAPENYTYILNSLDSMTIYDTEAVLSYFGYFASSSNVNIDVRITEAR